MYIYKFCKGICMLIIRISKWRKVYSVTRKPGSWLWPPLSPLPEVGSPSGLPPTPSSFQISSEPVEHCVCPCRWRRADASQCTVALLHLTNQPPPSKAPDTAGSSQFVLGSFQFYEYL